MNKVLGAYFGNQLRVSCQNGLGSSTKYNLYDLQRNNSNKKNCSNHNYSLFSICIFINQEKQDKAVLQAEVQHLRQDNMRLQEESQTAAAQLRKFTEWFFNTIDKKS